MDNMDPRIAHEQEALAEFDKIKESFVQSSPAEEVEAAAAETVEAAEAAEAGIETAGAVAAAEALPAEDVSEIDLFAEEEPAPALVDDVSSAAEEAEPAPAEEAAATAAAATPAIVILPFVVFKNFFIVPPKCPTLTFH